MYINNIKSPQDVKRLTTDQLCVLADEIRQALLAKLSVHGGHVGPNLGMVEATIALHYVFDSPHDKIVYDVSHQSYAHKILTAEPRLFSIPTITTSSRDIPITKKANTTFSPWVIPRHR